jgi:hypothetical protein
LVVDLERLGRDNDGGYVVPRRAIAKSDVLISMGINDDWSFETSFLALNTSATLISFDGSVSARAFLSRSLDALGKSLLGLLRASRWATLTNLAASRRALSLAVRFNAFFRGEQRRHVDRFVGASASPRHVTWTEIVDLASGLDQTGHWFVKMDIEGSEWEVLPDLLRNADKIIGLVIEYHDCDGQWQELCDSMRNLQREFALVHIHGNNYSRTLADSRASDVIETTWLRRVLMTEAELATERPDAYPLRGLDMPNDPRRSDYSFFDATADD